MTQMRWAWPYCAWIFCRNSFERGFVAGVARHDFIGQRKAFGTEHHRDDHLAAVGAFVPAVAVFGFGRLLHLALEISAGQVVEQQVVSGAEEIFPARLQMREERRPVRVNAIQTFVETVLGRHGEVFVEQLVHRAGQKPAAVQMPLAARSDQLAHRQQFEHFEPRHLGFAVGQALAPERAQLQFIPEPTAPASNRRRRADVGASVRRA